MIEETLSEKIWYDFEMKKDALWKKDVKEFIKKFEKELKPFMEESDYPLLCLEILKKLAGEELTK